jgi:hypothetical protein
MISRFKVTGVQKENPIAAEPDALILASAGGMEMESEMSSMNEITPTPPTRLWYAQMGRFLTSRMPGG